MKKHVQYVVSLGGFVSKAVYSKAFSTLAKARSFARSFSQNEAVRSWPVLVESYGRLHGHTMLQLIEEWINGQQVWAAPGPPG